MRKFINIAARLEPIQEGVALNAEAELIAFTVTVAEAYKNAPTFDESARQHWDALNVHTRDVLFKRLRGTGIEIEFTATDPYSFAKDTNMMFLHMLYDITVNRHLAIYTGDSEHPVFTEEQNVLFRAVHDFFAHGVVRKSFTKKLSAVVKEMGIKTLPPVSEAGPLLDKIDMRRTGFQFNGRGEYNAAAAHVRLAPTEAAPALFTEVVGQVSHQIVTGGFGVQKVAVLDGFDFEKIGKTISGSWADKRKNELIAQLNNGSDTIDSAFGPIDVEELRQRIATGVA